VWYNKACSFVITRNGGPAAGVCLSVLSTVFQSSAAVLTSLPARVENCSASPCPGSAMVGRSVRTKAMR